MSGERIKNILQMSGIFVGRAGQTSYPTGPLRTKKQLRKYQSSRDSQTRTVRKGSIENYVAYKCDPVKCKRHRGGRPRMHVVDRPQEVAGE